MKHNRRCHHGFYGAIYQSPTNGILFLPLVGVSINMISLFGFLIVLGIVVDDAVVVGENVTFQGPEQHLRDRGVQLDIRDDPTCIALMQDFIAARPELWNEDIGEP